MMGAAAGMPAHGDQHRPATIHWQADDHGGIGWLAIASDGDVDARIDGDSLELTQRVGSAGSTTSTILRVWVKAPGVNDQNFIADAFKLPGMTIKVGSSQPAPVVRSMDAPRLGPVLEAAWDMSGADCWTVALRPTPHQTF
jgi:hypothetical protein